MQRSALIDILKVVASQAIVLHHLSLYSPMAEWLTRAWPQAMGVIADQGRLAVQPFLVIGGFLAAQALVQRGARPLLPAIWQRYCRLLPQLVVALVLVVLATALVGQHLGDADWVSPQPSILTLLAHLLMLQDVLGIPSITAGAWYVAIDLQLFALTLGLAHLAARGGAPHQVQVLAALVAMLTALSLLMCSRLPALDMWAVYFFGAYGLGVLVGLVQRQPSVVSPWLVAVLGLAALDAAWDLRERALLALITALALLAGAHRPWPRLWPRLAQAVRYLSDISYSVFVCHFAVILLLSGFWAQHEVEGLTAAALWAACTWATALGTGALVQAVIDHRAALASWLRLRPAAAR